MKKIKYSGILPLFLMLLLSCNMEDKGNYDYISPDDLFPVKIAASFSDIRDIEFIPMEPAYFEPEFEVMDDYDRYEYSWYVFYKNTKGLTERIDIAQTRILDLEQFPLNPGYYDLYFEVKDPKHDLQRLAKASISVLSSPLGSYGIYMMKNDNGNTELDYYKFSRATEIPDNMPVYTNLVSTIFETSVSGKPVAMERFAVAYDWEKFAEDGTRSVERVSTGAWFIASENDIVTTKSDFSVTYKQFDGQFYNQPEGVKVQHLKPVKFNNLYFMNDNQVYGLSTQVMGIGRFAQLSRSGGIRASSVGMLVGSWYSLLYDEISGEFLYGYAYYGTIYSSATAQIKESTVLTNKEVVMNKLVEPIAIMDGGGTMPNAASGNIFGTMILKHKTLANTYYMTKSNANGGVPFTWIRPIDPEADIVQAPYPLMSSSYIGDVIYYVKNGNEIWYYADGGDTSTPAPLAMRQLKAASVAAGETIVNITPATTFAGASSIMAFSWITVTTNTADGHYKLYAFENNGSTPELLPTPKLVLTGEGEAVRPYLFLQGQDR